MFYIYVCPFVGLLKATYAENSHIVYSSRIFLIKKYPFVQAPRALYIYIVYSELESFMTESNEMNTVSRVSLFMEE